MDGIAQASLHGDRAHVIIDPDQWTPQRLTAELAAKGFIVQSIETVESSLEDVFTLLAHRGKSAGATE
jgi:ActR/RegA family two-component response regulator